MSLVKLIAQADDRGLAASGLACLDRCLPLLAEEADVLRPVWSGIAGGERDWSERMNVARDDMDRLIEADPEPDVATSLVRAMLGSAPSDWAVEPLRVWADTCSVVALEIHQRFDMSEASDGGGVAVSASERLARCREHTADVADGATGTGAVGPLVTGELRRQTRILEILDETPGAPGLRQAMDLSTEGQRVLRAVFSRRARARS